jgi:hypothetical protein
MSAVIALCVLALIGVVAIGAAVWIVVEAWRDIDHTPKPIRQLKA